MKYKVGDKVKLKLKKDICYKARIDFNKLPNLVAIVYEVHEASNKRCRSYYMLKKVPWAITEDWIECLTEPEEVFEPIENRWDILDLRKER